MQEGLGRSHYTWAVHRKGCKDIEKALRRRGSVIRHYASLAEMEADVLADVSLKEIDYVVGEDASYFWDETRIYPCVDKHIDGHSAR